MDAPRHSGLGSGESEVMSNKKKRGPRLKPEHPRVYDFRNTSPEFIDFLTKDAIERRDKDHLSYLLRFRQTPLPQYICRMLADWLDPRIQTSDDLKREKEEEARIKVLCKEAGIPLPSTKRLKVKPGPKPGENVAEKARNYVMIREYLELGQTTRAKGDLCDKYGISPRTFDKILPRYRSKVLAIRRMKQAGFFKSRIKRDNN